MKELSNCTGRPTMMDKLPKCMKAYLQRWGNPWFSSQVYLWGTCFQHSWREPTRVNLTSRKNRGKIRAGDETETNLETLTVAQRFERHGLGVQREKSRLGNQEKSHEEASLSHMTSGIQWQAMEAHKKGLLLSCKFYPHKKKKNFDCSKSLRMITNPLHVTRRKNKRLFPLLGSLSQNV